MAAPDDSGAVLEALRLGWYVAEVRGRNRPGPQPGALVTLPARPEHALPLRTERTATELRIEGQAVLISVAGDARVDNNPADDSSFATTVDTQAKALQEARAAGTDTEALWDSFEDLIYKWDAHIQDALAQRSDTLACGYQLGRALAETYWVLDPSPAANAPVPPGGGGAAGGATATGAGSAGGAGRAGSAGDRAATGNGADDAAGGGAVAGAGGAASDHRAAGPAAGAGAAAFGTRSAAGTGAAMGAGGPAAGAGAAAGAAGSAGPGDRPAGNPDGPPSWFAWSFLLGPERCSEIERLLGRLSAYFHPYTAAAIAGSVKVWESIAASKEWRKNASPDLYLQIRRWYELILLKQDPTTLLKPFQLLRDYRLLLRAARMFWGQLALAGLSAALLAFFAWALTQQSVRTWLAPLLGALGIVGISASGLTAKVKNDAQAALKRVKQDIYTDLIAVAITTAPPPPEVPAVGAPATTSPSPAPPAPAPGPPAPALPAPEPAAPQPGASPTRKQERELIKLVQKRTITPVTPI